jgi:two-component system nitrate/nitrite response regulator NarL
VTPRELGLTAQEGRVLQRLLQGHANKRIAQSLELAESTVKEYVTNILRKLGASSRAEVVVRLSGRRLVMPADPPVH